MGVRYGAIIGSVKTSKVVELVLGALVVGAGGIAVGRYVVPTSTRTSSTATTAPKRKSSSPTKAVSSSTSKVFAGYVAPATNLTVTSTFVVPTLKCRSTSRLSLVLVYIPDASSPGKNYIGAGLLLGCNGSSRHPGPVYTAVAFGDGTPGKAASNTMTVAPGNKLVATASVGSPATSSVDDVTTAKTVSFTTGTVGGGPASVGQCRGYSPLPAMSPCPPSTSALGLSGPANLRRIKFTVTEANGSPLGSFALAKYTMDKVDVGVIPAKGSAFAEH